jgi:hypothetical protein
MSELKQAMTNESCFLELVTPNVLITVTLSAQLGVTLYVYMQWKLCYGLCSIKRFL